MMPTTIQIPTIKSLEQIAGYETFVRDLQTAYNLQGLDPTQLRWVAAKEDQVSVNYPPSVVVNVANGTPQLAVNLHPRKDGREVTGHATYHAPLLVREVGRWGTSNLRGHKVTQWRGRSESETFFQKKASYPFYEFLDKLVEGLQDTTPVVEVVALLPVSPDGSYDTEFAPEIRFADHLDHRHYKIAVLMEGGFSAFSLLTRGQRREVQDIDKVQNHYNWKADFIADMSDIEQLMLPSSAGHMVLIVQPVEEERPYIDFNAGSEDYGSGFKGGGSPLTLGGGEMMKGGASIGGVCISQGSHVGKGSLYQGDLRESSRGNTVIYHIRFLGVKPDVAQALTKEGLDQAGQSLDTFVKE